MNVKLIFVAMYSTSACSISRDGLQTIAFERISYIHSRYCVYSVQCTVYSVHCITCRWLLRNEVGVVEIIVVIYSVNTTTTTTNITTNTT